MMDRPFPLGLPLPTAVYLTLYLATLMVHIAFMNYVLAGSATLAAGLMWRGRAESPVLSTLRDWMPFMLSAAITAGIAPLLFLQILYREQFYTANLLLFFRWMSILPALIAGFYLSYILKAKRVREWPGAGRIAVGLGAFAMFAFVGWSWVENHLLSVEPASTWQAHYAAGEHVYWTPELVPRLLLWFVAAFPTMALMVGWQLRGGDAGARTLAAIGIGGIVVSAAWSGRYFLLLSDAARVAVTGPVASPYLAMSLAGGAVELLAWWAVFRQRRLSTRWLVVGTVGLVVNFAGTAVMNESIRLATLDLARLYARHAEAWKVSGLPVFLFFFAVNAVLIAWCIRLTRRP